MPPERMHLVSSVPTVTSQELNTRVSQCRSHGEQAGMTLRGRTAQQLGELALESARWGLNLDSLAS